MRLTDSTDIALRVMIYAASAGGERVTIDAMTAVYGLSRSTVMKVVNALTQGQFLLAQRGRAGGLSLARPARDITVADIVRHMETDFAWAECMREGGTCRIARTCRLIAPLYEAEAAYMAVLERYSVEDLILKPKDFGLERA